MTTNSNNEATISKSFTIDFYVDDMFVDFCCSHLRGAIETTTSYSSAIVVSKSGFRGSIGTPVAQISPIFTSDTAYTNNNTSMAILVRCSSEKKINAIIDSISEKVSNFDATIRRHTTSGVERLTISSEIPKTPSDFFRVMRTLTDSVRYEIGEDVEESMRNIRFLPTEVCSFRVEGSDHEQIIRSKELIESKYQRFCFDKQFDVGDVFVKSNSKVENLTSYTFIVKKSEKENVRHLLKSCGVVDNIVQTFETSARDCHSNSLYLYALERIHSHGVSLATTHKALTHLVGHERKAQKKKIKFTNEEVEKYFSNASKILEGAQ